MVNKKIKLNKLVFGFTLVEMTVVLVIIGLLLAGLLGPIRTQVEARDRKQAQDEMKLIEEALYGFTIVNNRLPCPNDPVNNNGLENLTAGVCDVAEGNLPWATLGVNQFDPWGNSYQYRVDVTFADNADGTGTGCGAITAGISFELCAQGILQILDLPDGGGGTACGAGAPTTGVTVANNTPAVVYTQGRKNVGINPLSCYEQENTDGDNVFVFTTFSDHESGTPGDPATNWFYDDIVIWISPNVLKNKMVQAGRLP